MSGSPGAEWCDRCACFTSTEGHDCIDALRAQLASSQEDLKVTTRGYEEYEKQNDALEAQLAAVTEPGKASGIVAGLFALAQSWGLSWTSSRAPTAFLDEKLHELQARLAEAQAACAVLVKTLQRIRSIDPNSGAHIFGGGSEHQIRKAATEAIANLPAAVQRKIARDAALEELWKLHQSDPWADTRYQEIIVKLDAMDE